MNNHPNEHSLQQQQRKVAALPSAARCLPPLATPCVAVAVAMALACQTALALPDGDLFG